MSFSNYLFTLNKFLLILSVTTVSYAAEVDYFVVRGFLGPSDKNAINEWVSTYRTDKSIAYEEIIQTSQKAAATKNEVFRSYSSNVQRAFTETQGIGDKALLGQNDANSVESQLTRLYSRLSSSDKRNFDQLFYRVYDYDLGDIINKDTSTKRRGRRPGYVALLPFLFGGFNRRVNNYSGNRYYNPYSQMRPIANQQRPMQGIQRPPTMPVASPQRTFADASTQTGSDIGSGSSLSASRPNTPSNTATKPQTASIGTQTDPVSKPKTSSSTSTKSKTTSSSKSSSSSRGGSSGGRKG